MLTFRKPRRRHLTMTASPVVALLDLRAMAAGEIDLSCSGTAVRTHNSKPNQLRTATQVFADRGSSVAAAYDRVGSADIADVLGSIGRA